MKLLRVFIIFLIFQTLGCSNDNTVEDNPDNIDTDNDGIIDSEDIDDDNDGLIEIFNINQLAEVRKNLSANYTQKQKSSKSVDIIGFELVKDLDFDNPNDYENSSLFDTYTKGKGWNPIGTANYELEQDDSIRFGAIFNGNGFTIKNLYINRPDEDFIGFFGACNDNSEIQNLNIVVKSITGKRVVGGLVGLGRGNINNCSVSGSIISSSSGQAMVGLLVGTYEGGIISNSSTSGEVNSENGSFIGGLLGRLTIPNAQNNATISNSHSEANVKGSRFVGGLIGSFMFEDAVNASLSIDHCYATGSVIGISDLGGLVGQVQGKITACYAKGNITSKRQSYDGDSGGLFGGANNAEISACYATGNVNTSFQVSCMGGLVGSTSGSIIKTSYSIGKVSGKLEGIGGLVGCQTYGGLYPITIDNKNYWNLETSGVSSSLGEAQGLTTSQLKSPTKADGIYSEWDTSVWDFGNSTQYPVLKDMPNGIDVQR